MRTLLLAALLALPAGAALGACQGDGMRLTQPPPGGAGWWNFRGSWNGAFTGTPIAPHYFLTANHVGGNVGQAFTYRDVDYVTTARWSQDDLAIYRVARAFPDYASVYTKHDETGKVMVFYGRGMGVKTPIVVGGIRRGWMIDGPSDGKWSWGRGRVGRVASSDRYGGLGPALCYDFDPRQPQSVGFTTGDSGGAGFIRDGKTWKLAGIASEIDGPYSLSSEGPHLFATVFDKRGLYQPDVSGRYVQVDPRTPHPVPSEDWLSRVSSHAPWIENILKGAA